MNQRAKFIERVRSSLHDNVDGIIDSLYQTSYINSKSLIAALKVALDKLQNQSKKDD